MKPKTNEQKIRDELLELTPRQQSLVLDFVRALRKRMDDEDCAIGEVGAKLMTEILPPEDFSDWGPPKRGK